MRRDNDTTTIDHINQASGNAAHTAALRLSAIGRYIIFICIYKYI